MGGSVPSEGHLTNAPSDPPVGCDQVAGGPGILGSNEKIVPPSGRFLRSKLSGGRNHQVGRPTWQDWS